MPVKDTIKIAGGDGFVESTPDRSRVWQIQTPQVFSAPLIQTAYEKLMEHPDVQVTDDAMVAELMLGEKAYLVEGSYENLKITTQEDLAYGELICRKYWA
jgi:2-C-methyl-D-erythritol 4-phosphate cytidylyltransferase